MRRFFRILRLTTLALSALLLAVAVLLLIMSFVRAGEFVWGENEVLSEGGERQQAVTRWVGVYYDDGELFIAQQVRSRTIGLLAPADLPEWPRGVGRWELKHVGFAPGSLKFRRGLRFNSYSQPGVSRGAFTFACPLWLLCSAAALPLLSAAVRKYLKRRAHAGRAGGTASNPSPKLPSRAGKS